MSLMRRPKNTDYTSYDRMYTAIDIITKIIGKKQTIVTTLRYKIKITKVRKMMNPCIHIMT